MKINELYFGVKTFDPRKCRLVTRNLFDIGQIRRAVALYVIMTPSQRAYNRVNALRFCFDDVWAKEECEFMVSPLSVRNLNLSANIFELYAEPNEELLMAMVNSVSKASAKEYLKEWREIYG